jgi:acetyltransferase
MSIRHLDFLFDPATVAVIGASERPASVGATLWRNLRESTYAGRVYPVNPKYRTLAGTAVHPDVASLPEAPQLALICTPPATVPGLIEALGARGTKAAIVMTAGLAAEQRQAMLLAARKTLLRILGPNCLGMLVPDAGLNASFAHTGALPGQLAFVSQSGALVTAMLDWARGRGIGFSRCVSLGEGADVDLADMLDWLASDSRTRSILLYIESIGRARKFMSAARAAARNKPVIVVKAGRTAAGQAAAASHTGALAGSDIVFDAAIRRAGMLRVESLNDLFVAAETLAAFRGHPRGALREQLERLTVVTNGGGAGVLAADAAAAAGVPLAALPEALRAALDAKLPPNWSRANPIDIIGDAPIERYVETLEQLLATAETGTLLFMHAPTAIVPSHEIAAALVPLLEPQRSRVMASWLGGPAVEEARAAFQARSIPCYDTPEAAVHALAMLSTYHRNQELLTEAPPAAAPVLPDIAAARAIIADALAAGREWLNGLEAKAVLTACGVPVPAGRSVKRSPKAAAAAAVEVGFPVALKIASQQITHKSDVGGVALDLADAVAVQKAANSMLRRVRRQRPDARIDGFTVQAMVKRPRALELIVGASVDPLFGPVLLFGQGGTSVEVMADRAVALPPLNRPLARALVQQTRVARLLDGWRDVPPADRDAVYDVLVAVAQLMAEIPEIGELDINPLLADASGAVALDARVRISAARPGGAARFAIRPYPYELIEAIDWQGRQLTLRPIRPEDEERHRAFIEKLDPVDIRMRIFYSRRTIERSELARLTQIDYEREMAFVATSPNEAGDEETLAVARAVCDPDNFAAEFGIIVRSDMKGGGLGPMMMDKLIRYQRGRGTKRLVATVLAENERMLDMARSLGFQFDTAGGEAGTVSIYLPLNEERREAPMPAAASSTSA